VFILLYHIPKMCYKKELCYTIHSVFDLLLSIQMYLRLWFSFFFCQVSCTGFPEPDQRIVNHSIISNIERFFEYKFCRAIFALSDYVIRTVQESFKVEGLKIKRFESIPGFDQTRMYGLRPFCLKTVGFEWPLYSFNRIA